jgi:hypothetical protein
MKSPSSSLGEAFRAANAERAKQDHEQTGKPENQELGKPESRQTGKPAFAGQHELVNLSIQVRKRDRLHWLIEAKKRGTSLKAAIEEALNGRFGTAETE